MGKYRAEKTPYLGTFHIVTCNGNALFAENKLHELYNLYNENKGLICGGLVCREILNSSCLDFSWNSLFEVVFILKGNWGKKSSVLFLSHNFNYFMEKELCAKFCRVLMSSHKVMKLKSFESGVCDVISVSPGFLCTFLLILWKKNFLHSFMVVFDHFLWTY